MIRILLIHCIFLATSFTVKAQTRIVLNGGIIHLSEGAVLVVENPSPDAITRLDGHIISERQQNKISWNTGTATGNYTVPFGMGSSIYLPLSFTKAAGAGDGSFTFSTYRTGWRNSDSLPSGVTNTGNSYDRSAIALDRFWLIQPLNYTTKPSLTNLVFTYADEEHTVSGNTISEANLKAQRWNNSLNTWEDYVRAGTINTSANTLTVPSVEAGDLQTWWMLVDSFITVPVRLLTFTAREEGPHVRLDWSTASEQGADYFVVERSGPDGLYKSLGVVKAAGNSSTKNNYRFLDTAALSGRSFYRLKEVDWDGKSYTSPVRIISRSEPFAASLYPNPARQKVTIQLTQPLSGEAVYTLLNASGQSLYTGKLEKGRQSVSVPVFMFPAGHYILSVRSKNINTTMKFVIE
jgi:hypothetical protein